MVALDDRLVIVHSAWQKYAQTSDIWTLVSSVPGLHMGGIGGKSRRHERQRSYVHRSLSCFPQRHHKKRPPLKVLFSLEVRADDFAFARGFRRFVTACAVRVLVSRGVILIPRPKVLVIGDETNFAAVRSTR